MVCRQGRVWEDRAISNIIYMIRSIFMEAMD